ncbi:Glu-tRNA(Gln) amidotransferase subunit GatD [archaeon]|nr:Glu-tRNA(Gln) amidotransferase subunit GatD [archaeon]
MIQMDWKTFLKKHNISEGQLVKVQNGKQEHIGNIIPSSGKDNGILRLKLNSGYNIGIKISDKLKIEKLEGTKKVGKAKHAEIKQDPNLPKIAILHTGGTIASRVDYSSGAVYASFDEKDLLAMYPEISKKCNIISKHLSNMWSDDMRFAHYSLMANSVAEMIKKGVKGVIIGHGTDTLAYSSAALAFMLENVPIPVLFVGAQRSSDRGSSDSAMNLDCATEFILKTDFAGVAICMHDSSSDDKCAILPACKTRKMHSSRRDAFKAINDTPIALVDYQTKKIEFLKKDYPRKKGKFVVKNKMEEKVGLLKITTNMFPEQFSFYTKNNFKGVIIEGTGLGQAPGFVSDKLNKEHEKIWKALQELCKKSLVVMTTQTIFGRVHMHVYDKAVKLNEIGVIPGQDMLPETAFVKLAWLLANEPKKAKELIGKNLRGEITQTTKYDQEFLE